MVNDLLQYFKLEVIYPVTFKFADDYEEVNEIDEIRARGLGFLDDDEFEVGTAYFNFNVTVPFSLNPKCFIPKNFKRKVYYTELIFGDGSLIFAKGKPEFVYEKLNEYFTMLEEMKPPATEVKPWQKITG